MITNPSIQAALNDAGFSKVFLLVNAGAPTNGVTGTNVAGKGCLLADTTNGILYINTGTLIATVWTKVGTQT